MEYLSKSAYAASRNWSKPWVSKLGKQGRLVLTPAGLVDVAATNALIDKTSDPSKASVSVRHEQERASKGQPSADPIGPTAFLQAAPGDLSEPGGLRPDFHKARARREHFNAMTVEADFYKNQGTLVEMAAVDEAAYTTGRLLRDLLLAVPTQIAPELAAMTDAWGIEKHLMASIRRALEDAERISAADLRHSLSIKKDNHAQ